jgi:hypothetical protein
MVQAAIRKDNNKGKQNIQYNEGLYKLPYYFGKL